VDLLHFSWMRCCNGFVNGGWSNGGAGGRERNGVEERNGEHEEEEKEKKGFTFSTLNKLYGLSSINN